ncbi:hypothetical protein BKA69DRAFT_1123690 [Paraphysoderma sedebokerense]|nr:hypothetical protein BKA69DRAFT_1123690 [Paraphysoderma sedebokerense]
MTADAYSSLPSSHSRSNSQVPLSIPIPANTAPSNSINSPADPNAPPTPISPQAFSPLLSSFPSSFPWAATASMGRRTRSQSVPVAVPPSFVNTNGEQQQANTSSRNFFGGFFTSNHDTNSPLSQSPSNTSVTPSMAAPRPTPPFQYSNYPSILSPVLGSFAASSTHTAQARSRSLTVASTFAVPIPNGQPSPPFSPIDDNNCLPTIPRSSSPTSLITKDPSSLPSPPLSSTSSNTSSSFSSPTKSQLDPRNAQDNQYSRGREVGQLKYEKIERPNSPMRNFILGGGMVEGL